MKKDQNPAFRALHSFLNSKSATVSAGQALLQSHKSLPVGLSQIQVNVEVTSVIVFKSLAKAVRRSIWRSVGEYPSIRSHIKLIRARGNRPNRASIFIGGIGPVPVFLEDGIVASM